MNMAIRTVKDLVEALSAEGIPPTAELTLHIDVLEGMVTVTIDPGMITRLEHKEDTNTVQMLLGSWEPER